MFGLFGKSELENGTFNNVLIASISDVVRKENGFPNEDGLFAAIEKLIKGKKLSQSQANSVRLCAFELNNTSWAESELMPLIKGMQSELPKGGRLNYDKIVSLLSDRMIIISDEGIDFLKKYGL